MLSKRVSHRLPSLWHRGIVSHITDIEGNGQKFLNIIAASSALEVAPGAQAFGPSHSLGFRAGASVHSQLVYGGDVGDKGPYSLRLLRMLTDFKTRDPDRVHLIVGNREAKMTRILDELPDSAGPEGQARQRLLQSPPVFWNPSKPPSTFVANEIKKSRLNITNTDFVASLTDSECEVLYLKWMLAETMGCGPIKPGQGEGGINTFHMYRQEIAEIRGEGDCSGPGNGNDSDVPEERVLEVLKEELRPSGAYHKYLTDGVLMHRIGETLFVHGAITPMNLGFIPGEPHRVSRVDEWISCLNGWYHRQISDWARGDTRLNSATAVPGGSKLMWYLVQNPHSVVTTNWYSTALCPFTGEESRMIGPLEDEVVEYLQRSGINRVVTGHQPFSDCPLVLRHPSGFHVIVGDTSQSDNAHPFNNQGEAYHTLEISESNNTAGETHAVINAVRRNGNKQVIDLSDKSLHDFGSVCNEGRGVRRLDENGNWVDSQLNGFDVIDSKVYGSTPPAV
jgi:hypothetical protein